MVELDKEDDDEDKELLLDDDEFDNKSNSFFLLYAKLFEIAGVEDKLAKLVLFKSLVFTLIAEELVGVAVELIGIGISFSPFFLFLLLL